MKPYWKTWFWLIEQCKDPSSQSKEYINLYQYDISSYGQKNMEGSSTASWQPSKQLQYAILKEFDQKEFEDKSWQNGNTFIRLKFSESLTNPRFCVAPWTGYLLSPRCSKIQGNNAFECSLAAFECILYTNGMPYALANPKVVGFRNSPGCADIGLFPNKLSKSAAHTWNLGHHLLLHVPVTGSISIGDYESLPGNGYHTLSSFSSHHVTWSWCEESHLSKFRVVLTTLWVPSQALAAYRCITLATIQSTWFNWSPRREMMQSLLVLRSLPFLDGPIVLCPQGPISPQSQFRPCTSGLKLLLLASIFELI